MSEEGRGEGMKEEKRKRRKEGKRRGMDVKKKS